MIAYLAGIATVLVPLLASRRRPTWHVRFTPGGKVYTYRKSAAGMRTTLVERHEREGTWPHEVLPRWPE